MTKVILPIVLAALLAASSFAETEGSETEVLYKKLRALITEYGLF